MRKGWETTNPQAGKTVQSSLRKALIDSHVAAAAIALLLAGAIATAWSALLLPVFNFFSSLLIAVASSESHNILRSLGSVGQKAYLQLTFFGLADALNDLACAWLLSLWVYGTGPVRCLRTYRNKFSRKTHA